MNFIQVLSDSSNGMNLWKGATVYTYLFGGGIALLVLVWFGIRYWLATTRDAHIDEIPTPTIDRLNAEALARVIEEGELPMDIQDDPVAADLLAVVPEEDMTLQVKPSVLPSDEKKD